MLGGRHLYTTLVVAYHPGSELEPNSNAFGHGTRRMALGFGVGWRAPVDLGRLRAVEIEAVGLPLHSRVSAPWQDGPILGTARAQAAIRLFGSLSVLAGLGANVTIGTDGSAADIGTWLPEKVVRDQGATVRIYPALVGGIQLER